KRQQLRPAIETPGIVAHPLEVAMERLRNGPASPDRIALETRQRFALLREVLRVLEDLAVVTLLIAPVALEVFLARAARGRREDRPPPGTTERLRPCAARFDDRVVHRQEGTRSAKRKSPGFVVGEITLGGRNGGVVDTSSSVA